MRSRPSRATQPCAHATIASPSGSLDRKRRSARREAAVAAVGGGVESIGVPSGVRPRGRRGDVEHIQEEGSMRIGILTGGGDCPGLNAVIRAVVRKGEGMYGHTIVGYRHGWRGGVDGEAMSLSVGNVRGPLPRGGASP